MWQRPLFSAYLTLSPLCLDLLLGGALGERKALTVSVVRPTTLRGSYSRLASLALESKGTRAWIRRELESPVGWEEKRGGGADGQRGTVLALSLSSSL